MPPEQWFYRLEGKPHGPFNVAQFQKLIRGHTVTPETEVSTDGQTWQTLRAALAAPPADPQDWMKAPTLLPGEVPVPGRGKAPDSPN
jgi:hypothetical protein